jgi:hypothetical protein
MIYQCSKFRRKAIFWLENQVDTNMYVQLASAFFLFIGLYVDDTILASNHLTILASIKETLSKECEMTNSGEITLKDFKN